MFIIYDLIFLLFAVIYLPVYLIRKRSVRGFIARIGILPKNLNLNRPIWIHAVSVGEAMAIRQLIEGLRRENPKKNFVISTVTATGNKIAQGIAGEKDLVTYLPLDVSFIVKRVVNKINPSLFIIAETEIWPNIISYLFKKKIPIVVVNGRISDHSFKGYSSIKFLLKPILNKVNLFCVQTRRDQERMKRLGVLEEKIQVTGNMKFDLDISSLKFDISGLQLSDQEQLLVCGSTHPPEEEIILGIYKQLQEDFSYLRLLIAPRHPERTPEVVKLIKDFGFAPARISLLSQKTNRQVNKKTVYILDAVGQLLSFYAISDIVFVGGSLIKKGGHNILEPASFGKPVIFGPYMFNFQDIAELFLDNKAAILIHDKEDLKTTLQKLLLNKPLVQQLSQRAKDLIAQNTGSTIRNIQLIKEIVI